MEMYSVNMPSKEAFDLSSYIKGYKGIIIALDKKGNSIGYIVHYGGYDSDVLLLFKNENHIIEDDLGCESFEELLEEHPEIESLKLIKFN